MRTEYEIKCGDALTMLKSMASESVQCCVTSPPYFGLRDYGQPGQIGLEKTPKEFVAALVQILEEVRRVLKNDGTLWLNLGDSYAGSWGNYHPNSPPGKHGQRKKESERFDRPGYANQEFLPPTANLKEFKPKDLIGIPWRVAFALQEAGWWLRQDIIWSKPNPMPESVTDRCTKSHEYMFLLTKSAKYYFDQDAIREPLKDASIARLGQDVESQEGSGRVPGKTNGKMKAVLFGGNNRCPDTRLQSGKEWTPKRGHASGESVPYVHHGQSRHGNAIAVKGYEHRGTGDKKLTGHSGNFDANGDLIGDGTANKKSVWTVTTQPFKDAHFATFPEKLIEPCILAGSREYDLILDPFTGSGTTGLVSLKNRRNFVGIELNPEYIKIAEKRLKEVKVKLF